MNDDLGNRFDQAGPSQPVEVTGLNEVPQAGDIFMAFKDEKWQEISHQIVNQDKKKQN